MKYLLIILLLLLPIVNIYAADSKVSDLTDITSPVAGDDMYIVDDPDVSPASKKINIGVLFGVATDLDVGGAISADAVALSTDTTGNYADGDAEAGNALTGDSATSFFSSGTIEHERGGLEADVSGYTDGLYGQASGITVNIDTEGELETALGGIDVIVSTEIDTFSKIDAIVADEALVAEATTNTLTNKTLDDDTNSIHANTTYEKSRNVSGSTLTAGTPVYASGYNAGQDRTEIEPADADVAATMPAIGIVEEDILNNANGHVIEIGVIGNIDTTGTPVSESWSVGDMLYVSTTVGTLTNARPIANGDLVQFIATVTRSHATLGRILVQGAGRTNDIPNNLTMINTGAFRTGTTTADTALLTAYDVNGTSYTTFATLTAGNDPTFDLEDTTTIGGKAIQSQVLARVAGSTFSTVQHLQNIFHSAGWISGGGITDDADGTITVAAGTGLIRATDSAIAEILFTDWSAESGANVNLANNDINYIYVEYNSGSPQVVATTTERTDFNKNILLAVIQRTGTVLHINNPQKHVVGDHANNMVRRLKETLKFARVSGAVISATGTRNWAITTGDFWEGLGEFTLATFDSSGADSFSYWYRQVSDSGWNEVTTQSPIHQTNYDDNSGSLATLSNNKYGVHWCYIETDDHAHVVYGQGDYTLAEAEDANPPSGVPEVIEVNGILVGKIIIKESGASFTQIESAFVTAFTPSIATDHGALSGLSDVADHAYALLIDGTRALSGAWDMGSQNLTNVDIDSGTLDGITTLQMPSGDIGATGARITKGWFADLEVTNSIAGSITGNAATVSTIAGLAPDTATTQATQPNITSLGTLTTLDVDDININGNTISSSGASTLAITPTGGQVITLDGAVTIDAGVVTGVTSLDIGAVTYTDRAITVDTGGVLNIALSSAAGDDFTVNTDKLVVEGDTGRVGIGIATPAVLLELNGSDPSLQITNSDAVNVTNNANIDFRLLTDATERSFARLNVVSAIISDGAYQGILNFIIAESAVFGIRMTIKGANIGINEVNPDAKLEINGTLHVIGKTTHTGGTDPPYVLYDLETRQSTIDRVKKEVPKSKLGGATMFFNSTTNMMEIFVATTGKFFDLMGNELASVAPITNTYPVKIKHYFTDDGTVITMEVPDKDHVDSPAEYKIKENHEMDRWTGKFYKMKKEDDMNVRDFEVSKAIAIEQKIKEIN